MINKMSDEHGRDSSSDDDVDGFNLHDLDLGFGNGQRNIQSMVHAFTQEYDTLDHTLDELDSWMNRIEEQTDNLNSQMDELLQSSKQARLDLQQQSEETHGDTCDVGNGDIQALQAQLESQQLKTESSAELNRVTGLTDRDLQSLNDLHAKLLLTPFPIEGEDTESGSDGTDAAVTLNTGTVSNSNAKTDDKNVAESQQSDSSGKSVNKH